MYNDVIKDLLHKIEILPEEVIVLFLKRTYNLSEHQARQAVYAACRNRSCYKKGDNLARTPYIDTDSNLIKKAKAFRVSLEFLPESANFICSPHPWLLMFTANQMLFQVCYIEHNMELISSMIIAEKPIPSSEREYIKRIAIIDNNCDLNKMKASGFAYFCSIDENYNLKIIAKCDPAEAWNDVPEKA